MMQQTSLLCYRQIIEEGKIPPRRLLVYQAFKKHGTHTNLEISKKIFLPINQVTPRTNELVKAGILEKKRTRPCEISGRIAIVWGVVR